MPAFEKEYQRGGTEWSLLPEEIEVDPHLNGRYELPDIGWIVDSILIHGQLQPIAIRKTAGKPLAKLPCANTGMPDFCASAK